MDWITYRPPTEADGDKDGDIIRLLPDGLTWCMVDWSEVEPGSPWLPFIPPATSVPEPATPATITSQPRRFVSISRTVYGATHTIDAVADDGTAWWMVPGETEWTQLPALPDRG